MNVDNGYYGHREILAAYAGLRSPAPPIWGYLQHGWHPGRGYPDRYRLSRHFPKLVWSWRNLAEGQRLGASRYIAIGAPFLYLDRLLRTNKESPARTSTLVYPFHNAPEEHALGSHQAVIEAVREREKGEVSVCLYWLDFANMPLRRSYEEVGFRVVTHGRRDDPQFLHRQRSEIQRHARVVSNRVGTAIWYAAACAREVELYGPSFAVGTAEEGAEFDAFQRSEWPELFAGPLAAQPALELGRLELGHEYILPPSDLREVVGWTALRMLAEPAVHSAVAARRIAKRVRNTPRRGVPVAVRAEIGVGRRATRDNVSPDRRAVGVTLFAVSQWRAPTQTFVWREVEAAVSAGVEVAVLSLKRPAASVGSDPPIIYLRPARVSIRLLAEGARRPRRTVATLIDVAMRSSTQTALANLFAAASGLAVQSTIPKPSWIHAHFAWFAGTAAYALSRVSGVPNSVMVHAFDVFDDRFVDRLTAHKLRTAAFVGAESERIAEDVARRFGCRVEVVRMGVPPDFVVETTGPRTSRRVISVGSLVPKKGHDVLLRALAEVPGDWHAAVIGEGPERARLEALLSEYGLLGRVDFPGHLPAERVRRELDSAAVFCLASVVTPTGDRDGVPNVLIEAMARGLPVVAADVSGVPDLLGSDRGIIIRPGRADELADAISRVLADPLAARDRAERALAHVRDHYTTDVNWRRLHALMRMPS